MEVRQGLARQGNGSPMGLARDGVTGPISRWEGFIASGRPFQVNPRPIVWRMETGITRRHPIMLGKELVPGGFLIDEGGSPYIIVNHEEFVDPFGATFRFSHYTGFVKSSCVPSDVKIKVDGMAGPWRELRPGSLVMHGNDLLIRSHADHFFAISTPDALLPDGCWGGSWDREFIYGVRPRRLMVEPLKVMLTCVDRAAGHRSTVIWKPRYEGDDFDPRDPR